MENKIILFNSKARKEIKNGIDTLANAVKTTLGPQGQCVVIGDFINGQPHVTKDGVTVAKNIQLENKAANMGAQLIREAALKTVAEVGDATTTSTVLAQSFINHAEDFLKNNANPMLLKKGINEASKIVTNIINKEAKIITDKDINHIATISANNDPEIGNLIADAFKKITNDGVITVEESNNINTYVDIISGMQFDRGYVAPHFVTDAVKNECVLIKPKILITEQKINLTREIVHIMEYCLNNNYPLLIIAQDYDPEVIENLKMNALQGILKVCAIKAPSFGDYRKDVLEDLSILTDGINISYDSEVLLQNVDPALDLGSCNKVIITKDTTTIIGGNGDSDDVKKRIEELKYSLNKSESDFMTDFLKLRIAKLAGGVATIYVGGNTELEMRERKDRVDDAVAATKAAISEGIVAGGGITYLKCIDALKSFKNGQEQDFINGVNIIQYGLHSIYHTLLENANHPYEICDYQNNIGFDAKNEKMVNMYDAGIIDPAKASKLAFQNAVSVLNLYLSISCIIVPKVENPFLDLNKM